MEQDTIVEDEVGTILKDRPKRDKSGYITWLEEFKQTHYNKRPLTKHFWDIVVQSVNMGIDVFNILGLDIITQMDKSNPKRFKNIFVTPY